MRKIILVLLLTGCTPVKPEPKLDPVKVQRVVEYLDVSLKTLSVRVSELEKHAPKSSLWNGKAFTILTKDKTRLRVKEVLLPASESKLLGVGIDVQTLPEGHLSCVKCHKHLFECWIYGDNHRIEMGCMECGNNYRLLFPLDVSMPEGQGRFSCRIHPTRGMVLIHNVDVISIGCEKCYTEIQFKLAKAQGLIVAEDIQ